MNPLSGHDLPKVCPSNTILMAGGVKEIRSRIKIMIKIRTRNGPRT
jgi:hypothetical protein